MTGLNALLCIVGRGRERDLTGFPVTFSAIASKTDVVRELRTCMCLLLRIRNWSVFKM